MVRLICPVFGLVSIGRISPIRGHRYCEVRKWKIEILVTGRFILARAWRSFEVLEIDHPCRRYFLLAYFRWVRSLSSSRASRQFLEQNRRCSAIISTPTPDVFKFKRALTVPWTVSKKSREKSHPISIRFHLLTFFVVALIDPHQDTLTLLKTTQTFVPIVCSFFFYGSLKNSLLLSNDEKEEINTAAIFIILRNFPRDFFSTVHSSLDS